MGYSFTITNGFRVRAAGEYPWPWHGDPDRKIFIDRDDVLTKSDNGDYFKHTGLGCCNINLTDEQVEPWNEPKHLRIG